MIETPVSSASKKRLNKDARERWLKMITFTLIFSQPGPGIDLLTPVVDPALPDDVVPGAGQLVQIPGTVAEDRIENVLVSKQKIVFVLSKHPSFK